MIEQLLLLLDLFIVFFQIGLFTIGGGYAMIPLITSKVIEKGWATKLDILDYMAVAESTPGPFSVNTATFVGMSQAGIFGAIFAVFGLVLPSFVIIVIIAKFFVKFLEYKYVNAALGSLKPAIIGLMCSAAVSIAFTAFTGLADFVDLDFSKYSFRDLHFIEIIIFAIIFVLSRIKRLKFNSYKIIIVSAILGILFYGALDFLGI